MFSATLALMSVVFLAEVPPISKTQVRVQVKYLDGPVVEGATAELSDYDGNAISHSPPTNARGYTVIDLGREQEQAESNRTRWHLVSICAWPADTITLVLPTKSPTPTSAPRECRVEEACAVCGSAWNQCGCTNGVSCEDEATPDCFPGCCDCFGWCCCVGEVPCSRLHANDGATANGLAGDIGTATLIVSTPVDAVVSINGRNTTAAGSRREYLSVGLHGGRAYEYIVRAQVFRDGRALEDVRQVTLRRNDIKTVVFSLPRQGGDRLTSYPDQQTPPHARSLTSTNH